MLKILGRSNSSNVEKVLWCCDELELDYHREDIGGPFGGNKEPEYLALNPNSTVPTMIEDDFVLWESNSIVRYLAEKSGENPFYPSSLQIRASAGRWMDWQLAVMHRAHVPVFVAMTRTPPEKRNLEKLAADRKVWSSAMAILDTYLGETAYISGPDFTFGDIPVGISAFRWFALDIEREDFSNLLRWYNLLSERPAFRKNVIDIGF